MSEFGPIQIGSYQLAPGEWEAYVNNPDRGNDWKYSLAYAYWRQHGAPHEDAVQMAQREAYEEARSANPEPESKANWRWAGVPLSTPFASLLANTLEDRTLFASQSAQAQNIYNQLRLGLESRVKGRFVSPTKVSNPEDVATATQFSSIADVPVDPEVMNQAIEAIRVPIEPEELARRMEAAKALLEGTAPKPEQKARPKPEAMSSRGPMGKRMAGGLAVTGGLGLGGLLALAALTDPHSVEREEYRV